MPQNLHEGSHVSYVGSGGDGRTLGERGCILAITGRSGHVKWTDQTITLVDLDDVAPIGYVVARIEPRDDLADSLEVGPVQVLSNRGLYTTQGGPALLDSLTRTGQLTGLVAIAEEARAFAEARVREDPELRRVASELDPEEGDELFSLAATALLRNACGVADVG